MVDIWLYRASEPGIAGSLRLTLVAGDGVRDQTLQSSNGSVWNIPHLPMNLGVRTWIRWMCIFRINWLECNPEPLWKASTTNTLNGPIIGSWEVWFLKVGTRPRGRAKHVPSCPRGTCPRSPRRPGAWVSWRRSSWSTSTGWQRTSCLEASPYLIATKPSVCTGTKYSVISDYPLTTISF